MFNKDFFAYILFILLIFSVHQDQKGSNNQEAKVQSEDRD